MVADLVYDETGNAQMFSVLETPWHQEGLILSEQPSFEDAIELIDYPLEKRPYYVPSARKVEEEQVYHPSTNAHYVCRPDTDTVLGTVGKDYEVVRNKDAFEILRPLVEEGHLELETGGVLRDGKDAWLLGKWNMEKFGRNVQEVFSKDGGLLPYATVLANHSGRRGIMVGNTTVRICCSNTLSAAESRAESDMKRWEVVPHFRGAKERLSKVGKKLFDRIIIQFETIARHYNLLMNKHLTENEFSELVLDAVAKDPIHSKKFNPEAKLANVVRERARFFNWPPQRPTRLGFEPAEVIAESPRPVRHATKRDSYETIHWPGCSQEVGSAGSTVASSDARCQTVTKSRTPS